MKQFKRLQKTGTRGYRGWCFLAYLVFFAASILLIVYFSGVLGEMDGDEYAWFFYIALPLEVVVSVWGLWYLRRHHLKARKTTYNRYKSLSKNERQEIIFETRNIKYGGYLCGKNRFYFYQYGFLQFIAYGEISQVYPMIKYPLWKKPTMPLPDEWNILTVDTVQSSLHLVICKVSGENIVLKTLADTQVVLEQLITHAPHCARLRD